MHKIPNTFCPAKWDELIVNYEQSYAYACCKGTPTRVGEQVVEFINKEKLNLLNNIQDPSCNYCWAIEAEGHKSLRMEYLEKFEPARFQHYQLDQVEPRFIEVNVGNECNFQCTYCNPKFSSKWEHDVRLQPYTIFSDRYFFGVDDKQPGALDSTLKFLQSYKKIQRLSIVGGEPLLNKKFFSIIESIESDSLSLSTNLSCKQTTIDKLIKECSRYQSVSIRVSIDATGDIAEFSRLGLDYQKFVSNLNYLIANRPANLTLVIGSVMSSITVRDLDKFSKLVIPLLDANTHWHIDYCQFPVTQSMKTLPDHYRAEILDVINGLEQFDIKGLNALKSVIVNTKFNKIMHQELKHFMQEFSTRKNIKLPLCLD
jgi:sulfatase maturation enzyme AslB (radical SAM superfamily)